ncbi:MAG: transposase [Armatimonadota bacterium]
MYLLNYHLIWCPKRRKPVLTGKVKNRLRQIVEEKAKEIDVEILAIENLNIKGMVRNRHLSKSIADCSWGMFFNLLCYKAEEAGRIVIKVNPHGTSQKCSNCGKNVSKDLSVRVHHCSFCGIELDRDLNAAINILRFGQNLRALTQRTAASVA